MSEVLRIRFATTNAPESLKRGLIRDRLLRARRVLAFYVNRRVDVGALQESGTYGQQVAKGSPIKALYARFNDLVNGRQVGNGGYVKRRRWKSRKLDDLTIGTGDDAVHIAVIEVTHRRTGFRFRARFIHKPTRRAGNKNLRPVIDAALRQAHRRDDAAGIPWVDLGDFNGGAVEGVELGSHGPDHITASDHFRPAGERVVERPLLSDHSFLIADATVEV